MDRQTLRDWVHRYNAGGLAGLSDRPHAGGPARLLTAEQEAAVAELVRAGPDVAVHGVVRWRRLDFAAVIAERFGVTLAERTVGKLLHRLGFVRLSVRPRHPAHDAAAQQAHKKTSPRWSPRRSRSTPAPGRSNSGGRTRRASASKATLTRVWAPKGSRPPAPRDQRYAWAHLFGAVCPARGVGAGLVLPVANSHAMNEHLAEISRQVAPGAHAVVTLDGAGWHLPGGKLRIPDNISLLPLPPYSPQLNPVENVWQFLRQNHLSNRVYETYDAIVDACCEAWNALVAEPKRITSIATRDWAQVSA
jgi:transposase